MHHDAQPGQSLKQVLDAALMTQQQLANAADLALATVSKAARGLPVSKRSRLKMERALGCSVGWAESAGDTYDRAAEAAQ